MVIDSHTHIFSPGMKEGRGRLAGADACFLDLYSSPKARMATAEELISSMDDCGIDASVVLNIGWVAHDMCHETNEYILEAAARYPKRLIPFCSIQPKAGNAALDELERCARAGAKGIGEMRSDIQGFDLADRDLLQPFVDLMQKYRLVFLTHASEPVGHEYPGKGAITPGSLYRFICHFPHLKVVCAHWGGGLPFYALMPEVASALGNTHFDTAATPFLYRPQIFQQVAEIAGPEKILFGSDYPLMSPKRVMAQVRSLEFTPEVEAMILGGNAGVLLGWS